MRQLPAPPSWSQPLPPSDGIEIADVARTVRAQWRAVIGFTLLGTLGAVAVLLFAPRKYEGKASLLARASSTDGGSVLGRLGSVGDLMRGGGLGALGSQFESELQMLRSRAVAGSVVDSLQLQFLARDPRGVPVTNFIERSSLPGRFGPRKYRFERQPNGAYRVQHAGQVYDLVPGQPGQLDVGSVVLRPGQLPQTFTLKVLDREDAITRLTSSYEANKAGGEVAKVTYRGEDSVTAAAVPNLLIATYLERRKTVDRGVNERRVDYVTAQLEATGAQLAATERALRHHQETSGILDAEVVGKAELEGAIAMRESLTVASVEEGALNAMLAQAERGSLSARDIAAFPTFIRGTAVSTLASELTNAEAARIRLLERRTERDPEVLNIDQSIKALETKIIAMARSYTSSVSKRRVGLAAEVDSMQRRMLKLPAAAEQGGRMQRDVMRLTSIYTALQAQLVEARLAAIGEGGEVRQIDAAVVARKPAFPEPFSTMGIGLVGGLVSGIFAALMLGWFGRWFRDPVEIERATGVAVQRLTLDAPLLVSGTGARTVLVVPLADGAQVGVVAQRLAHTATTRSLRTHILDLSANTNGNGNGTEAANPAALIEKLEAESAMLVVQLPGLASEATVAALHETRSVVLVAPPGRVDRGRLASALDLLRRAGVPCAGVVISEPDSRRTIRA
jgi:uncharacterized protein involved in exopolysaccharide biosynthesis